MAAIKGGIPVLVDTGTADVVVAQYQVVVQGASDYHVTSPGGANASGFQGVTLDETEAANESVPIVRLGTAWVQAAGAIASGDYVSIANAKGQVQSGGSNIIGVALSTATTAGDIILMYISPTPGVQALKKLSGTTDATAGTQDSFAHGLGYAPTTVLITPKGDGTVYESAAADATNIYLSASAASIAFDAYVG